MGGAETAIAFHLNTIDIDARHQSAAAINRQIPVNRKGAIRRNTTLHIFPQLATRHIKNINCRIHHAVVATVIDDKRCVGRSRILRTDDTDVTITA